MKKLIFGAYPKQRQLNYSFCNRTGSLLLVFLTFTTLSWGQRSIIETTSQNNNFSTLKTALFAANLDSELSGNGPFTIFAPTNSAFTKLPKAKLQSLLLPKNKNKLRSVLTYHAVPGKLFSSDLLTLSKVKTLNGQTASISLEQGILKINKARILKTDVVCSNGIIHIIDSVIIPKLETIVEVAQQAQQFTLLLKALEAAELVDTLKSEGPFTVFAPTDQAFRKLSNAMLIDLFAPESKSKLQAILKHHVIAGRKPLKKLLTQKKIQSLQNDQLAIDFFQGQVKVNDSFINGSSGASNGIIHIVDTVLIPKNLPAKPQVAKQTNTNKNKHIVMIIEKAINYGAPIYNQGQPFACAAIYEVAIASVLHLGDLPVEMQGILDNALLQGKQTPNASQKAWIYRRAMDKIYTTLKKH